jgi:hypothetical protein
VTDLRTVQRELTTLVLGPVLSADDRFAEYGVTPTEVVALRQRTLTWAGQLADETGGQPVGANR